ncbi:MAG TPA: glycosyltransferase family A protein, partial [Flavobacterium sp.]|nr:glycosyltransferase family A protein [Flavobacterium sp.]
MPTYNRAEFLGIAIKSVLNQSFEEFQLVVVDDGSTDNTKQVVKSFNDSRIKYIYQQNKERSAARNNGIIHANGKYICFLDSDDYCLPDHLASFYKIIKESNFPVAMFYCNTLEDRNGELLKFPPPQYPIENSLEFVLLNTIGVPRSCIHCDIFKKHKFDESTNVGEDVALWVQIL